MKVHGADYPVQCTVKGARSRARLVLSRMCAPRYHTLAAARPALAAISSSRRAIAFVAATAILGTLFYQLRRRAGGCNPAPMCRIWSCSKPLAAQLEDEWPSWPPVSRNGIPRDNLPGWSAEVRWRSLHRQQAAAAAAAAPQTRLVFLGDSITEGWLRSGFSGTAPSIPQPVNEQLWHDAFGLWSPLNLAIGGDRVQVNKQIETRSAVRGSSTHLQSSPPSCRTSAGGCSAAACSRGLCARRSLRSWLARTTWALVNHGGSSPTRLPPPPHTTTRP